LDNLVSLVGATAIGTIPAIVGFTTFGIRARIVDMSYWAYPIPFAAFALLLVAVESQGSLPFLLVAIALSAVALVATWFLVRSIRTRRFQVTGIAAVDMDHLLRVIAVTTGRHGKLRPKRAWPTFETGVDFLLGPPDSASGMTWLGFRSPLRRSDRRNLERNIRNEILARWRWRSNALSLGFVAQGIFIGLLYYWLF